MKRFSGKEDIRRLRGYFASKYVNIDLDLIIAVMAPAFDFVEQYGNEMFPDRPVVFCVMDHRAVRARTFGPNVTGSAFSYNFAKTLETAVTIKPDTRRVVVISDTSLAHTREMTDMARRAFRKYESRLELSYVSVPTLLELLRAVENLPPETVVFYVNSLVKDDSGTTILTPMDAREYIAGFASAPIYGVFELKTSSADADMDQVNEIIDEIRKINGESAEFLATLAYGFEYGKIVELIETEDQATG